MEHTEVGIEQQESMDVQQASFGPEAQESKEAEAQHASLSPQAQQSVETVSNVVITPAIKPKGRPKGSKDSKPRKRVQATPIQYEPPHTEPESRFEQQDAMHQPVAQLEQPQTLDIEEVSRMMWAQMQSFQNKKREAQRQMYQSFVQ